MEKIKAILRNAVVSFQNLSLLAKVIIILCAVATVLLVLYKLLPAVLVSIACGIMCEYEYHLYRKQLLQIKKNVLVETLPDVMLSTLRQAALQLSILPPGSIYEIEHAPYCTPLNNTAIYHFDAYKKERAPLDSACLRDYAAIVQDRLDRLIDSGEYLSPDAYRYGGPIGYHVIDIQDTGITLLIRIAPVFDKMSVNDVIKYTQKTPLPTPPQTPLEQPPAVPLAYDNTLFQSGVPRAVLWKYQQAAHMIVFGSTGSGKTYFVKQLIGNTLKYVSNPKVMVCDFKSDDFRFLASCPGYYAYTDCARGLEDFYKAFEARQMGTDTSRDFRLLVFDEWAAYLSTLDKKQADAEIKRLSTLLMLGRSFECHIVISQQRADAQYFSTARDNFNVVIALGNLSNESRDMFFRSFKDEMTADQERGTGYMLTNGTDLTAIRSETVNMEKLERYILRRMTKTNPPADAGEA